MENNLGGYNAGHIPQNSSLQRPLYSTSPQLQPEDQLQHQTWQPTMNSGTADSSNLIPYNYSIQHDDTGSSSPQARNTVVHSNMGSIDQYSSNRFYGGVSSPYGQENISNTPQNVYSNVATHSASNYAQNDITPTMPPREQVYQTTSNQNFTRYNQDVSNRGSRADSPNWRVAPPTENYHVGNRNLGSDSTSYREPFNAENRYERRSSPSLPRPSQTSMPKFKNPLMDNSDDNSPDLLVSRMQQGANNAKATWQESGQKPTISLASLAMIENDLKEAAKPFESAESLQQCRNKQLGFSAEPETLDVKNAAKPLEAAETLKKMRDLQLEVSPDKPNASCNSPQLKEPSKLSVHAAEFVPRGKVGKTLEVGYKSFLAGSNLYTQVINKQEMIIAPVIEEHDAEAEESALNLIDDCIFQLTCDPASFDNVVPLLLEDLRSSNLIKSVISVIVDKIYEKCVVEQNFRYLGSLLLDKLSRNNTGLPEFRSCLLTKAQTEFERTDVTRECIRARNFTQFMAELFLNLKLETDGGLVQYHVLGRGTLGVVRKLVDNRNPDKDNIQCAIRVLKLTVLSMEDSFSNEKDIKLSQKSRELLASVLNDLENLYEDRNFPKDRVTASLLESVIKLRASKWGRVNESVDFKQPSQFQTPDQLSQQDENYYMNEPMFFTPSGKMYTAADAVDPDFYSEYLAPFSQQRNPPRQPVPTHTRQPEYRPQETSASPQPNASYYRNPLSSPEPEPTTSRMPYTNWSSGLDEAADQYDYCAQEDENYLDDYDAEFQAFLNAL